MPFCRLFYNKRRFYDKSYAIYAKIYYFCMKNYKIQISLVLTKIIFMKKTFFLWILLLVFLTITNVNAQQQESYTFCTGNSYAYLLDTTTSATSTYFARWTIGNTGYTAHFQKDTIYQSYGSKEGGGYGSVKKWACTGKTAATCVWTYATSNMHHDLCPMPNGNVIVIVEETKTSAQIQAAGGTYSSSATFEAIKEIHPTGINSGTVVWEWHLFDHLCQDNNNTKPNYTSSYAQSPQRFSVDLVTASDFFHMNGIDYNPTLDQIVFSSHMKNEVYVIDHSTTTAQAATGAGGNAGRGGDFLYRWGRPQNYGCTSNGNGVTLNVIHDVRWVPATNTTYPDYISIFHNGGCSGGHAAVLFQPPHNGYNYTYTVGQVIGPTSCTLPTTPSFSVQNMGGCQVLNNGNVLIQNPNVRFYELNGSGTTYQQVQVGSVQADRLKYCEVVYPTASATVSNTSICVNTPITLGSSSTSVMETSPTYTYSWTSNIGGFSSSSQNPTATPASAGNYTYTVTVTNSGGCTSTASVNVTVDACAAIEENTDEKAELNIYPNPTTGVIYLNEEFTLNNNFENLVYNSLGKFVTGGKNQQSLDITGQTSGIYYLRLITENKDVINKKIILIK